MKMSFDQQQPSQFNYPEPLQNRINEAIRKVSALQKASSYDSYTLRQQMKSLICSQNFEDWIVVREVLSCQQLKRDPHSHSNLIRALQSITTDHDQSYIMLVFLYGWIKSTSSKIRTFDITQQLKNFAAQGKISMFTSWLAQTDCQSAPIAETITMMCEYFPLLVTRERLAIETPELELVVQLVCHAELEGVGSFQRLERLCDTLKGYRVGGMVNENGRKQEYDIMRKEELLIIRMALNVMANTKNCTGCAAWIFCSSVIAKDDIRQFVSLNDEHLLLYTENQLLNIFRKLFEASLEENTLVLFHQFSRILQEKDKFYELKILYQKVLLPILARRGKAKMNLIEQVLNVSAFYVIGFYDHCDIGQNGLICLLGNLEHVEQEEIRKKWIQLAFFIVEKNAREYEPIIYQELTKIGYTKQELAKIDDNKNFGHFPRATIWQITAHSARKIKTYSKKTSRSYKGIENHSLQCYIISVMQALFTTKELPKILKQFYRPPRDSLCNSLRALFFDLQPIYKGLVSVDNVKINGPEMFAISERQQDAQDYLLNVFEMVENELKKFKEVLLLDAFHKAFKSKITRKLQCQSCKHVIDKDEELFIHTIPSTYSLRERQVEQISDYRCQKCKSNKILNRMQLHLTSTVFIVHFNRFSFQNDKSRKELPTQTIKRDFLGYRLKGIVFHIGKNVEYGHYVYYFCCGGKKWVEMNDSTVLQFVLDHEDQEFQREMKAEMTPYILFYVKQ